MTREYLMIAAEILAESVNDGQLRIDDYCFDVIAMGFRRLDSRKLAIQLRQEEDAELAKLTIAERATRILMTPEPVREMAELTGIGSIQMEMWAELCA
jgi:hypothetical protein